MVINLTFPIISRAKGDSNRKLCKRKLNFRRFCHTKIIERIQNSPKPQLYMGTFNPSFSIIQIESIGR